METSKYTVLGVGVNALTMGELNALVSEAVDSRSRLSVGSQNLHGVYTYHRDEDMRRFQSTALIRVDGMSLVFVAKLCGLPLTRAHRVTWVDWLGELFHLAEGRGWKVAYCGSSAEALRNAREEIKARWPRLSFFGRDGYFSDPSAELEFVGAVNQFEPDILIVGMGMPRQERFILKYSDALTVPVIMTSGAALEYLAGVVKTPPRWMGKVGLEWLYRLLDNPRRLAGRYLVEPWYLAPLLVKDIWRYRLRRTGRK